MSYDFQSNKKKKGCDGSASKNPTRFFNITNSHTFKCNYATFFKNMCGGPNIINILKRSTK